MDNQIENQVEVQPKKQKSGKGLIALVVVLVLLVLGLGGYIAYDKVFTKESEKTEEPTQTETQVKNITVEENVDTAEYYQSHSESLTKDVWKTYKQNWEEIEAKCDGTIGGELYEIILNNDSTYEYHHHLICGGGQNQIGTYTLENNILTLVCNPDKSEQCGSQKVFQKSGNGTLTNNEGLILNKVTKEEIFYFVNEE